jgi:hypothetical protein
MVLSVPSPANWPAGLALAEDLLVRLEVYCQGTVTQEPELVKAHPLKKGGVRKRGSRLMDARAWNAWSLGALQRRSSAMRVVQPSSCAGPSENS